MSTWSDGLTTTVFGSIRFYNTRTFITKGSTEHSLATSQGFEAGNRCNSPSRCSTFPWSRAKESWENWLMTSPSLHSQTRSIESRLTVKSFRYFPNSSHLKNPLLKKIFFLICYLHCIPSTCQAELELELRVHSLEEMTGTRAAGPSRVERACVVAETRKPCVTFWLLFNEINLKERTNSTLTAGPSPKQFSNLSFWH